MPSRSVSPDWCSLSELELSLLRARSLEALRQKARRGEVETIRPYEDAHWGAINEGIDPGASAEDSDEE